MATVVVTLNVMPKDVETSLSNLENSVKEAVKEFDVEVDRVIKEPIAFGLHVLKFLFLWDENKGGTDDLEEKVRTLEDVASAEVSDVRRAIG
ncbi:MAG: elongation factor 1-beta [Candidatus Woesearchaeota archaeon]|nr:MAG: elongation factor 1-beta [Candidatus Woesearchaeota archaeon]